MESEGSQFSPPNSKSWEYAFKNYYPLVFGRLAAWNTHINALFTLFSPFILIWNLHSHTSSEYNTIALIGSSLSYIKIFPPLPAFTIISVRVHGA